MVVTFAEEAVEDITHPWNLVLRGRIYGSCGVVHVSLDQLVDDKLPKVGEGRGTRGRENDQMPEGFCKGLPVLCCLKEPHFRTGHVSDAWHSWPGQPVMMDPPVNKRWLTSCYARCFWDLACNRNNHKKSLVPKRFDREKIGFNCVGIISHYTAQWTQFDSQDYRTVAETKSKMYTAVWHESWYSHDTRAQPDTACSWQLARTAGGPVGKRRVDKQ